MFSSTLFVIEIIIAEFLLTFRLKRNKGYQLRFICMATIILFLALIIPNIDNAWYTCLVYIFLFSLTLIGLKILYSEPWINIIFCGIAAYTMQHFAYQFTNLIFSIILWGASPLFDLYHMVMIKISGLTFETLLWAMLYIVSYYTCYVIVWFLFVQRINKNEDLKVKNKFLVALVGACLLFNIILNAMVIFSNEEQTVVNSIVRHISGAFNCLLLLQWQFGLVFSKRMQTELDITRKLLSKSQEQYNISKANMDLIDLKCHDMKHQIREIGSSKQLDEETVSDLEKAISVYDSVVKVGSDALDVILTEKSFKCFQNDIILKCIAEGKALSFMKDSDIYTLFGNLLDNAIEAVMKLQDENKRVISLKVYSVGELLTINIKNYYDGTLTFNEEGFLDTTKVDKDYHGYGMKSIYMLVEKYEGNISILLDDGIFNVNILIPIKRELNNATE